MKSQSEASSQVVQHQDMELNDERLESVLYETSNVVMYSIPAPRIVKIDDHHLEEYHDITQWDLSLDKVIFKGILRVKEQEFLDDEDSDEEEQESNKFVKTALEETRDKLKLIVELIKYEDFKVWAEIEYYCLSPEITTFDNTSFYTIHPVNNSNLFSTFIDLEGFKMGCGLKFSDRNESKNFQIVLLNFQKDFQNYVKMVENNRKNLNRMEYLTLQLHSTRFSGPSNVQVREVTSTDDDDDNDNDDDDDDDFGDFVS